MKFTNWKIALALGFIASSMILSAAHAENLVGNTSDNQISVFDSANLAAASLLIFRD